MNECKYCGAPLDDDSQFCANCGKKIEPQGKTCPCCGAEVEYSQLNDNQKLGKADFLSV